MAKSTSRIADEYSGTGPEDNGPIDGPSAALDPDAAAGTGPSNSAGNGSGDFDARIHVGPDARNADGSYTKRRGRKSGGNSGASKAHQKTANLRDAIEGLTKTLVIIHVGFAGITGTPEMAIDEDEARMLANAGANVLEQFDLKPDPKTQAIVGFVIAAGTIYGPRAYMISARKAQERVERKANPNTGEGIAGVYAATGEPMGTTGFTVDPRQPLN